VSWGILRDFCAPCSRDEIRRFVAGAGLNYEEVMAVFENEIIPRGAKRVNVLAAAIYLTAKRDCIGLLLKEIADFFSIRRTRGITRAARTITLDNMGCPFTTPDLILQRFGDPEDKEALLDFYYIIQKEVNLVGRAPSTIAAAVEYMFYKCFTGKRRYQHHIVEKHGVTEVAIRNCCKVIEGTPYYQKRLLSLVKEKARSPITHTDVFKRCGYEPPICPFCGKRYAAYNWGRHMFYYHGDVEIVQKVRKIGNITRREGRYTINEERRNQLVDSWLRDAGVLK